MDLIRLKKPKLSIDIAPLIDVVFQLLVFFMLTSTFANPAIKMVLPKAVTGDATSQQDIIVSVNKNGEIFINDQITHIDSFQSVMKEILEIHQKNTIHIKGDKDMPYSYFVQIMDLSRQAGAMQINIVHQKFGSQ